MANKYNSFTGTFTGFLHNKDTFQAFEHHVIVRIDGETMMLTRQDVYDLYQAMQDLEKP